MLNTSYVGECKQCVIINDPMKSDWPLSGYLPFSAISVCIVFALVNSILERLQPSSILSSVYVCIYILYESDRIGAITLLTQSRFEMNF